MFKIGGNKFIFFISVNQLLYHALLENIAYLVNTAIDILHICTQIEITENNTIYLSYPRLALFVLIFTNSQVHYHNIPS